MEQDLCGKVTYRNIKQKRLKTLLFKGKNYGSFVLLQPSSHMYNGNSNMLQTSCRWTFFFQQKLATHSISLKYMRHLLKDNRNNPYSPTLSHKQNVLHKIDNDKKMKLFMSIFYFPQYFTIFFL